MAQVALEAARVLVQAIALANADSSERPQNAGPKLGGLWWSNQQSSGAPQTYAELRNFKMEIKNMFQNYSISQAERVPIIKNWLGRQGLQLLEALTQAEQEAQNTEGLFETLSRKFKPQYNETIKWFTIPQVI